ncbi:MAG: tetratricopeptide repeat protein [Fuerstiella sp.]|nr:tetratricopeptide repeat protein [Fuerstiella sp.]
MSDRLAHLQSSLPLSGESVAFTGTLASMTHRAAGELTEQYGGRYVRSVSRVISILVVGEEGWPLEDDGQTSQKLLQACNLIADGAELRILSESDWLHLTGLNEQRDDIRRAYTPAMLSQLLVVPVSMIRRWARIGLIRPVRRICRLPYFDYREVSSAQRLASLLDEGVSPAVLETSLTQLSQTLAGTDRSLSQLNLLVQDEKVVIRDQYGVVNPRTGQRLLDFEAQQQIGVHGAGAADDSVPNQDDDDEDESIPVSISFAEASLRIGDRDMQEWTSGEWFHEGCRLAEESACESAVNAFRNSLSLLGAEWSSSRNSDLMMVADGMPDPAEVNFNLADALYRMGRKDAAIERYHCAIEFAPDFIEAWTQLGCLHSESGDLENAEDSFQTAIAIHAANPDALLHYAQLLDSAGRVEEALECWKEYLRHDFRGPWADHARERLQDAEVVTT